MLGVIKLNEYNYDYLGINGMIPNSALNFTNTIPQNNMINNNYDQSINNMNNNILNPTKGFIRGNMFNNLYDPYKNYKPANLDPKNELDAMLMSYLQYNFTLNDLNLYLDNYPNDNNAINLYKQYLTILKNTKDEYEKKYGPLTCNSIYALGNDWKWNNSPWPWEVI